MNPGLLEYQKDMKETLRQVIQYDFAWSCKRRAAPGRYYLPGRSPGGLPRPLAGRGSVL